MRLGLLSQPHLLLFNELSVLDIEGEGALVYWTW